MKESFFRSPLINSTNGNSDYLVSDFVCVTRSSPSLRFRRETFMFMFVLLFVRHINERANKRIFRKRDKR